MPWFARWGVEPAWLSKFSGSLSLSTFLNPASAVLCWEVVAWLAVFARRSVQPSRPSGSICQAGLARTPERGASLAFGSLSVSSCAAGWMVHSSWKLLPGWLCSHARAWSQRHLGTCRLSTLPAPCCVEKLLPGWLSSHAGAWSHGFDSNSVEECLGSHAGAWSQPDSPSFLVLSLSTFLNPASAVLCWEVVAWLAVFARRSVEPARPYGSICQAGLARTPERGASLAFGSLSVSSCAAGWMVHSSWKLLPGWLCSHAGAWSQPGF